MATIDELLDPPSTTEEFLEAANRETLKGVVERLQNTVAKQKGKINQLDNKLRKKKQPVARTHLIIGDAHATPSHPLDRFDWLGRMIEDYQPEVIVDMGDWCDAAALCEYDLGKFSSEGRRLQDDIDAAVDARERVTNAIAGVSGYKPELYALEGNHEHRFNRFLDAEPRWIGKISLDELQIKEMGWAQIPFLEPLVVDGVLYRHFHPSKLGKAIAPAYHANALLVKNLMSSVVGHSHLYDFRRIERGDGSMAFGLVAGCFTDEFHPYAGPSGNSAWARGIALAQSIVDGSAESVSFIPMEEIQRRYS